MYSIMDLEPEDWMRMMGVRPGDIQIFAGGPPCQGFSTANSNRSLLDERNKLPMRFIYYCKVCKPKVVLMENVPGLLTIGRKKGEKEGPFPIWIKEKFDEAGYDVSYEVHNAADYGVPQNRKRVIFFAVRKGENTIQLIKPTITKENPGMNVREAIGDLPPVHAGETWKPNDTFHPYGYNHVDGYVICPSCLKYNQEIRKTCVHCNFDLSHPIKGGVLHFPGFGFMTDCKKEIDNEKLREIFNKNYEP
jgi:site-specific DNA-cytosine methylase